MLSAAPTVKTPVFEGPLDLLIELIEARKLLINDIALAAVTDEYIARVEKMEEMPLGETSSFVALAATLLLIKSRSLLPTLEITEEENRDIKELEYRLALYQIIRRSALVLGRLEKQSGKLYAGTTPAPDPIFAPDKHTTLVELRAAARKLIDDFPKFTALPKVAVRKAISLETTIEKLASRISSAMRLSFKEFSGHGKGKKVDKYDVVVSFLALLELVKRGIIKATQERSFDDITLEQDSVSTPSYGQ